MLNRIMVLMALAATAGSAVQAADNKLADAKTTEAAEKAAAMERAQRMAANPMRVILEASKVRRRGAGEGESGSAAPVVQAAANSAPVIAAPRPSPADGSSAVRAAALAAVQAATTPALRATAVPTVGGSVAALPVAEVLPTVNPARQPAPTLTSPAAAVVVTAPAPLAAAQTQDAVPPSLAVPAALAAAVTAPLPAQPKLRTMVEPNIPARVLSDIGKLVDVQADLTIRPDGTVAAVRLVQPVPRQLTRYLMAAFEAWRFEPLPAEREHRIQLVFNDGN